jgi:hypothetical protein
MIESRRKLNAEKRRIIDEISEKVHGNNKFFDLANGDFTKGKKNLMDDE